MKTTTITPRPKRRDPAIIKEAAAVLAKRVLEQWIQDDCTTVEEIAGDLAEAMSWRTDGYEIAKELDGVYDPDAALVEILDGAYSLIYESHAKACAAWVAESGIQAPAIGSKVKSESNPKAGVGEVVTNYPDGRSTVSFPDLGHVKEGSGTHGLVLEWEVLTPAP